MQGLLNNHLNLRKAAVLQAFGVNVVKSNMNDLSKANKSGEGSRGGKIIGHTKSGKPVYEHSKGNSKNFTTQDHNDAANLHYKLYDKHGSHSSAPNDSKEFKDKHPDYDKEKAAKHLESYGYHKDRKGLDNTKNKLKQHLDKNEEHFYSVVSKHYQPSDDGESEHTMLENLSKHKNVHKILEHLDKKKK